MTFICHRRGPKQHPSADCSVISEYTNLKKNGGGEGKKKYPARQCKMYAACKKRSETRNICKFCIVLLHKGSCFEKYHSVTNYMQFLQSQAQEHNLLCQTVRICYGVEHSKFLKRLGTGGI
jgi:hypothetical protein